MKTIFHIHDRSRGFTLMEVLIALVVTGLLLIGLTRLYSVTLHSYSLQEQMAEMNQNAKFVMRELTDILIQAGADCMAINSDSTDKDTIIRSNSSSDFCIKVNPRGGIYTYPFPTTKKKKALLCTLQVDDAYSFRLADSLGQIPSPSTSSNRKVVRYKLISWDTTGNDSICFTGGSTNDSFCVDDVIFSYSLRHYYLNGTDLCLNNDTNVLAENIDSLKIFFKTKAGAVPTDWKVMYYDSIAVCAKTSQPDFGYSNPPLNDHKRRIWLTNVFRMKNKL